MLSVQSDATQTWLLQMLLSQSLGALHAWPLLHVGQPPPQSTSVSEPFIASSLHVGAGAAQVPLEHSPLAQSDAPEHALPLTHGLQLPPQSTSVSVPLCTVSLQLAAAH
jgi:hypothetical protein